jgi:hypothetical protein
MKERPNLILGVSEGCPRKNFVVARLTNPDYQIDLKPDDYEEIFLGDESLGSAFVGWGIIKKEIRNGNTAVLIFHPDENPTLP